MEHFNEIAASIAALAIVWAAYQLMRWASVPTMQRLLRDPTDMISSAWLGRIAVAALSALYPAASLAVFGHYVWAAATFVGLTALATYWFRP